MRYIDRYSARIRDVELITGLEFFTDRRKWRLDDALELRTRVTEFKSI